MNDYSRLYAGLSLRDKKDPKSIINLAPSWLSNNLATIPDEVLMLSEDELRKKANPYPREEKLRISFWQEYYRVANSSRPQSLNISNICGGICDNRTFQVLVKNSYMLAFILTAPPEVNNSLEELLQLGFKRSREIMVKSAFDEHGVFNKYLADAQFKIYMDAMNRRRGPVAAKIEATGKNLHLHKHQQVPLPEAPPTTNFDIEEQIAADEPAPLMIEGVAVETVEATEAMRAEAIEIHSEVMANEPEKVV